MTTAAGPATVAGTLTTHSFQTEGHATLTDHCDGFPGPNATSNYILPPYFLTKYPEVRDPTTSSVTPNPRTLTPKEQNQLRGIETAQTGELAEHDLFMAIHHLSCKKHGYPFLSIHSVDIDTKDKHCSKRRKLRQEFPILSTQIINTRIELDDLVFIKNIGVIAIEVKATGSVENLYKAEKQLSGGQKLFMTLMSAIEVNPQSTLPYVCVICLPGDSTVTSTSITKTGDGSYILNRDIVSQPSRFERMWNVLVSELLLQKKASTFLDTHFEQFMNMIVGLWSSRPSPSGLVFERYRASIVHGIQVADESVSKSVLSSDPAFKKRNTECTKKFPLTNIAYNELGDIPRKCKELELIYFTMEQKFLFHHHRNVIVRGVAGSGKSLLILMKIIDLVRSGTTDKILLITSFPFHLKCQNILTTNSITSDIVTTFPLKPSNNPISSSSTSSTQPWPDVVIMTLGNFFNVPIKLQKYDLDFYHIFIDDLQKYHLEHTQQISGQKYPDISLFIDSLYLQRKPTDLYLWVCLDILQSLLCEFNPTDITSLFYIDRYTPRHLRIPTFSLTATLRNTSEIIGLAHRVRKDRIDNLKELKPSHTITATPGHNITCTPIVYQKLQQSTDNKHKERFMLLMLEMELQHIMRMVPALLPSQVAILCDAKDVLAPQIQHLVSTKCSFTTQSVEDFVRHNNYNDMICDDLSNISSFEFVCVVYIRYLGLVYNNAAYNLITRARSKLVVIDCHVTEPPITTSNIRITNWRVNAKGD